MTDAFVAVSTDGAGKKIDNEAVTVAGSSVYRQRVEITGVNPTDIAPVTSSGGLSVNVTGGVVTSVAVVTSLSSGLVYQGTSPWVTQAATSGGAQAVAQSSTPWVIVASSTGGAQSVAQSSTPWVVVSSTTGGAVAVSTVTSLTSGTVFQGSTPWPVVASSTGGAQPVVQSASPWLVVASTTGGNQPVSIVVGSTSSLQLVQHTTSGGNQPVAIVVGSTSSLQLIQAATSGGAQPVAQSSTPWVVVSTTTGGAIAVSTVTSLTSGTVYQGVTPWQVVASSTGGAQQVIQSATPWTVVSSTTGGTANAAMIGIVRATQPTAIADATTAQAILDTKGRAVVTLSQVRQLITQQFLQLASTCETILLAGSSGTYHDLMALVVAAATSNTIGTTITFKDSSGGATQVILNSGTSVAGLSIPIVVDFDPPWKHSTATSTGSAWTVALGSAAGTVNISAQFSNWTS